MVRLSIDMIAQEMLEELDLATWFEYNDLTEEKVLAELIMYGLIEIPEWVERTDGRPSDEEDEG